MSSKAKAAKNTKLKRGDGGSPTENFTLIGEVRSISGPSESVETIDVTSQDSTAKEFISAGLVDGGEVTFEMNLIGSDAQQQGLRDDMVNGRLRNFKLELNDHASTPTTFSFAALVTGIEPSSELGSQYLSSVTLKISGLTTVTWAPA